MKLRSDIKDPSPEIEQYMDDPLENMSYEEFKYKRETLDIFLNESNDELVIYDFPFEILKTKYDNG